MECAAKGLVEEPCAGSAHRRCGSCGAVAYCSKDHQFIHWRVHKEECARLSTQMSRIDMLSQFPFTFSIEPLALDHTVPSTRCLFLESIKVHLKGLWKSECICGPEISSVKDLSITAEWNMESSLCPCTEPENPVPKPLASWEDYYQWRSLPLHSPVALLLHWPLTLYHCLQLSRIQTSRYDEHSTLRLHYLGPEKELLQLTVFAELHALFPGVHFHIELVGPAVPRSRDGEVVNISSYAHCSVENCDCRSSTASKDLACSAVTLKLWKGFYHERYGDMNETARRGVANEKYQKMRSDLEAEKEAISKAKDIVEQSKHIQQLDSENKILKQERKDMLKMHEDSMKVLQDSTNEDMNHLKEEITILKDQKKAADEQNQRHLEAYRILRQERDSLAETLQ